MDLSHCCLCFNILIILFFSEKKNCLGEENDSTTGKFVVPFDKGLKQRLTTLLISSMNFSVFSFFLFLEKRMGRETSIANFPWV